MRETHFHSFDEFADYTKGKSWVDIRQVLLHDYKALEWIGRMPWRQRGLHAVKVRYEESLGAFWLLVTGGQLPPDQPKNAQLRKMLEQIRSELESRNQWPDRTKT
jgi:hypothetical protein